MKLSNRTCDVTGFAPGEDAIQDDIVDEFSQFSNFRQGLLDVFDRQYRMP